MTSRTVRVADAWVFNASAPDTPTAVNIGWPQLSVASNSNLTVAFSGTIFEPDELAARVGARPGELPEPADLVLRACTVLGDQWLRALRGNYAVVVVDRLRRRTLAVRDAMGLHPLFVARGEEGLLFSWSAPALVAEAGVSRELNRVMLAEHLVHRWSDPRETYYAAVQRVPPGHVLESSERGTSIRRYWDPATDADAGLPGDDALDRFNAALSRAVTRCLDQGRAAIFLSGGFDSISIAAVAVDEARRRGQPGLRALSLGFPDPECNEEVVQRGAAGALGIAQDYLGFAEAVGHRGLLIPALEMAASWPAPMMNLWNPAYSALAARGVVQGCQVVLTGSGGDEWLAVSPYLSADLIRAARFATLARFAATTKRSYKVTWGEAAGSVFWTFGMKPIAGMLANRVAPRHWQQRRHSRIVSSTPEWVAPDPELRRAIDDRASRVLAESEPYHGSFYEQQMRTALEHPLNTMEAEEYFEQGRRLGVRILHPYWDADLVSLLYRTPPEVLSRGGRAKGLVRATIARRFPDLGFERQKKVHATNFYWRTMQTEGPAAWRTLGTAATLAKLGVLDAKLHASTMAELFEGKRPQESYRIWNTLHLEGWARLRA